jgi:hypothetical protein
MSWYYNKLTMSFIFERYIRTKWNIYNQATMSTKAPPPTWRLIVTVDNYTWRTRRSTNPTKPYFEKSSGKVICLWKGFYLLCRTTQYRKKRTYMYCTSLRLWDHCVGLHFRNSRSRFLWLVLFVSPIKCSYTKSWNSARLICIYLSYI